MSLNAGESWQKWTAGFPTVSTKDLAIHPREEDLVIGTFGRAAWILDDIRPLRAVAGNPQAIAAPFQTRLKSGCNCLGNQENTIL